MPTYEEMKAQLEDVTSHPLMTHEEFDAWESAFYKSNANWQVSADKIADLILRFTELKQERISSHSSPMPPEDEDGLTDEEMMSIISSDQDSIESNRKRGLIPANDKQVGVPRELTDIFKYDDASPLQRAFGALEQDYPGARTIRGDGNCYFRAVMYSVLEQAITASPGERWALLDILSVSMVELRESFDEHFDNPDFEAYLEAFHDKVMDARDGQCWRTLDEFEADLRNPESEADRIMVAAARAFTAEYLNSNPEISAFLVHDEIDTTLLFGEDARDAVVDSFALYRALGIQGRLERIEIAQNGDAPQGTRSTMQHEEGGIGLNIDVNILLKPGHYDLIYTREQWDVVNQAERNQVFKAEFQDEFKQESAIDGLIPHMLQIQEALLSQRDAVEGFTNALLEDADKYLPQEAADALIEIIQSMHEWLREEQSAGRSNPHLEACYLDFNIALADKINHLQADWYQP